MAFFDRTAGAKVSTTSNKHEASSPKYLAQEMKDRESKRWLLEEFVKENEIRAVELEMAYKRFKNLAPSSGSGGGQAASSVEMDFNTWILVSFFSGQGRCFYSGAPVLSRRVAVFSSMDKKSSTVKHLVLGLQAWARIYLSFHSYPSTSDLRKTGRSSMWRLPDSTGSYSSCTRSRGQATTWILRCNPRKWIFVR